MMRGEYDMEKVREVMMEYGLQRYMQPEAWGEGHNGLEGNFFGDNPGE